MEIRQLFNTTKKEIESKKFNIMVPICLGNKFFVNKIVINKENMRNYITWALKYTKNKVIIVIVDKIQNTNYNVRSNNTRGYNQRKVLRDGFGIRLELEKFLKEFSKEEQEKIKIIQWKEYEKEDSFWKETTNLVYKEFEENKEFRNTVLNTVKTSVTDRKFSEEEYLELCKYILDEFSLAYSGTIYKKDYYGLYLYPFVDSTVHFLDKIQKGEIFPELSQKLPKEKMALMILN